MNLKFLRRDPINNHHGIAIVYNGEKRQASANRHPLKRIATPQEIALLAVHLLSDASAWLTGQVVHLDGGMSSPRTFR